LSTKGGTAVKFHNLLVAVVVAAVIIAVVLWVF
jgi:hypothetical protein